MYNLNKKVSISRLFHARTKNFKNIIFFESAKGAALVFISKHGDTQSRFS